jgi:uncharacterized protein
VGESSGLPSGQGSAPDASTPEASGAGDLGGQEPAQPYGQGGYSQLTYDASQEYGAGPSGASSYGGGGQAGGQQPPPYPSGEYAAPAAGGLRGSPAGGQYGEPGQYGAAGQYEAGQPGGGHPYAGGAEHAGGGQWGGGAAEPYAGQPYQGGQYQGSQYPGGRSPGGQYQGGQYPGGQYGGASYGGQPAQPYGQPGYPQQAYGQSGGQPLSQSDERLWATISHISIPFFGIVGPLIVYLVFKDRSGFLKDQGTESLNFSILYTLAQVVSGILTSVLIGAILLPIIFVGGLVLCIMAALAANKGTAYRYPVNWRLIK